MSEPIVSVKTLTDQVKAAIARGTPLDEAHDYPFGSDAAHHFGVLYRKARAEAEQQSTTGEPA